MNQRISELETKLEEANNTIKYLEEENTKLRRQLTVLELESKSNNFKKYDPIVIEDNSENDNDPRIIYSHYDQDNNCDYYVDDDIYDQEYHS